MTCKSLLQIRTLQAFEGEEGNREKIGKPERGRRKKGRGAKERRTFLFDE